MGDELCSGTETSSAISIFAAGLIQLNRRESSFIFATHFHEITYMKEIQDLERLIIYHMAVIYDRALGTLIYDRKLSEGPGNNMYGLEVCKSLDLPQDFLMLAHNLRQKKKTTDKNILLYSGSNYNRNKIKGVCEICNKVGVEVHHLQHQKDADSEGFINHFHKNHKANLMNVCATCHLKFHVEESQHYRIKTSEGMKIRNL